MSETSAEPCMEQTSSVISMGESPVEAFGTAQIEMVGISDITSIRTTVRMLKFILFILYMST